MLFTKNEIGGEISARLFTIVQTAKANGLKAEEYIEYLLEKVNKAKIDNLLPWSKKLPKDLKAF